MRAVASSTRLQGDIRNDRRPEEEEQREYQRDGNRERGNRNRKPVVRGLGQADPPSEYRLAPQEALLDGTRDGTYGVSSAVARSALSLSSPSR